MLEIGLSHSLLLIPPCGDESQHLFGNAFAAGPICTMRLVGASCTLWSKTLISTSQSTSSLIFSARFSSLDSLSTSSTPKFRLDIPLPLSQTRLCAPPTFWV